MFEGVWTSCTSGDQTPTPKQTSKAFETSKNRRSARAFETFGQMHVYTSTSTHTSTLWCTATRWTVIWGGDIINKLLGRRANSLHGARLKGDGVITDEVYTYNEPIITSTYGRCKSRPLWGCQEVSLRGPPRGSLAEVATRHMTAITTGDINW
jgi:hypothetical protein